jgi:Siphovirus Gp157
MNAPPNAWQLERVIGLAMATIEALRTEHGQVFDDDETLLASLSEEGVDVDKILRRLASAAIQAKADAAAADAIMDDLKIRRDRFRRAEEIYRATILNAMEALGITKFPSPQFSLTVSAGKPKVLITDETILPDDLMTWTKTPNKASIKAALETYGDVPGAVLGQAPPVLTIRVR